MLHRWRFTVSAVVIIGRSPAFATAPAQLCANRIVPVIESPCPGLVQILPQQPVEVLRFVASGVRVRSEPLILRSLEGVACGAA